MREKPSIWNIYGEQGGILATVSVYPLKAEVRCSIDDATKVTYAVKILSLGAQIEWYTSAKSYTEEAVIKGIDDLFFIEECNHEHDCCGCAFGGASKIVNLGRHYHVETEYRINV